MFVRQIILIVILLFNVSNSYSQKSEALDKIYTSYMLQGENLKLESKSKKTWFQFYKNNISEQISANCQFEVTCSEFMHQSLSNKKTFRNFLLGLDRLTRCGSSNYVFYTLPALINYQSQKIIDNYSFYIIEK